MAPHTHTPGLTAPPHAPRPGKGCAGRRLLMVTTVPSTLRGFLLPFAEAFAARGWRVDAAADGVSSCAECVGAFDRVWDVRWSRNPLAPGNLLRAPRTLRDLVAREGYDLVHVHTPVAGFVARFALRELRRRQVRVIYTAHGFHFYRGGRRLRNAAFLALERLAGRWTDHLVVINREDEEAARRHRIVPPDRVCYMPGIGVDPGRYDPARVDAGEVARVRAELRVPPGGPLFTLVGEFIPRKRHRDALRAFARLAHPEARLALAGDGPLLGPMKELAARLGLGERVHFLAFRRDVPALVRSSSAVLLVSEQEGLPRSVLEALSLEVPVIGTDIRGTRELLAGGAGLRVPVGDVAGLAAALDWVARHPDEARQMGRAGRLLVQREFSHEVVLRLHEDLYARALGEG